MGSQANDRGSRSAHDARSVVFPYPGGARIATTVVEPEASRRSSRAARGTGACAPRCGHSGGCGLRGCLVIVSVTALQSFTHRTDEGVAARKPAVVSCEAADRTRALPTTG